MLPAGGRHPGGTSGVYRTHLPRGFLFRHILPALILHHEPKKAVTHGNLGENNSWSYFGSCSGPDYPGVE